MTYNTGEESLNNGNRLINPPPVPETSPGRIESHISASGLSIADNAGNQLKIIPNREPSITCDYEPQSINFEKLGLLINEASSSAPDVNGAILNANPHVNGIVNALKKAAGDITSVDAVAVFNGPSPLVGLCNTLQGKGIIQPE